MHQRHILCCSASLKIEFILILKDDYVIIETEVICLNVSRSSRAEDFLKLYRMLEGLLENRYVAHAMNHSSVVREYLDDPDSMPFRTQLDLCREIRNLLSHNADAAGEPVVEPSEAMIDTLKQIIEHVQRPRLALECGTPGDRIMFAFSNERVVDVIRRMQKHGYSHVPVRDGKRLIGVFSAAGFLTYLDRNGFSHVSEDMRIADMKDAIGFESGRSEKYIFLPSSATILVAQEAFQKRRERNSRVAVAFITRDGESTQDILAMLTPWDVLRDESGEQ